MINARINKISFFLWLTQKKEVVIKDKTVDVIDENGKVTQTSHIEKTHPVEIFIYKFLPAWVLYVFLVHIPNVTYIIVAISILLLLVTVAYYVPKHFKKFLILLSALGLYFIVPNNGFELHFEQIVYVIAMLILFIMLAKDTYSLFYEDQYYFLEDVTVEAELKGTRTSPAKKKIFKKIPFFGLTNKETRVKLGKMSFGGYYLKVKKEDIQKNKKDIEND